MMKKIIKFIGLVFLIKFVAWMPIWMFLLIPYLILSLYIFSCLWRDEKDMIGKVDWFNGSLLFFLSFIPLINILIWYEMDCLEISVKDYNKYILKK